PARLVGDLARPDVNAVQFESHDSTRWLEEMAGQPELYSRRRPRETAPGFSLDGAGRLAQDGQAGRERSRRSGIGCSGAELGQPARFHSFLLGEAVRGPNRSG